MKPIIIKRFPELPEKHPTGGSIMDAILLYEGKPLDFHSLSRVLDAAAKATMGWGASPLGDARQQEYRAQTYNKWLSIHNRCLRALMAFNRAAQRQKRSDHDC